MVKMMAGLLEDCRFARGRGPPITVRVYLYIAALTRFVVDSAPSSQAGPSAPSDLFLHDSYSRMSPYLIACLNFIYIVTDSFVLLLASSPEIEASLGDGV